MKIRRWIFVLIVSIALVSGIYYIRLPEYKVYCSITNTGADFRETDLHVIVYKSWDMEETIRKIVLQYKKMNGVPSRLAVHLYHSEYAAGRGKFFYEIIFVYGDDEMSEPPAV